MNFSFQNKVIKAHVNVGESYKKDVTLLLKILLANTR